MIKDFKRMWKKPSPLEMASTELADAELQLLEAFTTRDYANSIVLYNETRIARLRKTIVAAAKAEQQPKAVMQVISGVNREP